MPAAHYISNRQANRRSQTNTYLIFFVSCQAKSCNFILCQVRMVHMFRHIGGKLGKIIGHWIIVESTCSYIFLRDRQHFLLPCLSLNIDEDTAIKIFHWNKKENSTLWLWYLSFIESLIECWQCNQTRE